jgi:hypothetical protein
VFQGALVETRRPTPSSTTFPRITCSNRCSSSHCSSRCS